MNSITFRTYLVAGLVAAIGGFGMIGKSQAANPKNEVFMEGKAPATMDGYTMVPGQDGGMRYTYKMDEGTYKTLKPYGIVARQFTDGVRTFDAVLITSDSHESFHDPQICFSSQSWTFRSVTEKTFEVPGVGSIPMTVAEMDGPRSRTVAVYFYKGPNGFVASPKRLQLDMFSQVLKGQQVSDATFYRFMPVTDGVELPQLEEFIRKYMLAAKKASGGYY